MFWQQCWTDGRKQYQHRQRDCKTAAFKAIKGLCLSSKTIFFSTNGITTASTTVWKECYSPTACKIKNSMQMNSKIRFFVCVWFQLKKKLIVRYYALFEMLCWQIISDIWVFESDRKQHYCHEIVHNCAHWTPRSHNQKTSEIFLTHSKSITLKENHKRNESGQTPGLFLQLWECVDGSRRNNADMRCRLKIVLRKWHARGQYSMEAWNCLSHFHIPSIFPLFLSLSSSIS